MGTERPLMAGIALWTSTKQWIANVERNLQNLGGAEKFIDPSAPVNNEEWRNLPLWRPHDNHQQGGNTNRLSRAQLRIYELGIGRMDDIMDPRGQFLSWDHMAGRGLPQNCRAAYLALVSSLVQIPELNPSLDLCDLFVENRVQKMVWQFLVPPLHKQTGWLPFLDRTTAQRAFKIAGDLLVPAPLSCPGPQAVLQRIVVQAPRGRSDLIYCGPWNGETTMLAQYKWKSGLPLLNSSTASIRRIQNSTIASPHTVPCRSGQ